MTKERMQNIIEYLRDKLREGADNSNGLSRDTCAELALDLEKEFPA